MSMSVLMELAEKRIKNETPIPWWKQELIFAMLQACASRSGTIYATAVLENLPDGYVFAFPTLSSLRCGPDDVYVSPSPRFGAFICVR